MGTFNVRSFGRSSSRQFRTTPSTFALSKRTFAQELPSTLTAADASTRDANGASPTGASLNGATPDTNTNTPVMRPLSERMADVTSLFPSALSLDDALARIECALGQHGFRGDNAIAITNVCRDESTAGFKRRLDAVFGSNFSISGLGGCITCGCLGLRAAFSHAPTNDGRERYIFFSFPHIAVAPDGRRGIIARPGREGQSSACGALIAALSEFKANSYILTETTPGSHSIVDPEYSILKQRLAARLAEEELDVVGMYLPEMTALAERAFTADLEALIADTVNPEVTDYAVVTGVQVHSWAAAGSVEPTLEWLAPSKTYVVTGGERVDIDLATVPALTPRQLALLQDVSPPAASVAAFVCNTTVVPTPLTDPAAGALAALKDDEQTEA